MSKHRTAFGAVSVILAALAVGQGRSAAAAAVSVNPTQVFLTGAVRNALVSVRNESDEPLRFQLTVFSWKQEPDGQMSLAPTQDVIFFPQLFTLAPGEERNIRVGTMQAPDAVEKTYRLFIEELPPSKADAKAGALRVLTKIGVPIFLRSTASPPTARLRDLTVSEGRLSFTLANDGTTHFVPQRVVVRGIGPGGEPTAEQIVPAWYVLAGSIRTFDVELASEAVSTVVVEVLLPGVQAPLSARLDLPRRSIPISP